MELCYRNSRYYPRWVAVLALLGGIPTFVRGVVMAYNGFSSLAYDVNMSAGLLILVRVISVGALMWRRGRTAQMAEKMERNTDWTS